ncbi:MAG: hypothetical protein ACRD3S_02530 [Terracidiphilus sp.]
MGAHTRKYYNDLFVSWLHVPLIALIVFVCGTSITVRLVLFIVASVFFVLVAWPSDSKGSPHVTDTSGPF